MGVLAPLGIEYMKQIGRPAEQQRVCRIFEKYGSVLIVWEIYLCYDVINL